VGTELSLRPTVLIVDDTPANLTLLASVLTGYRVRAATCGEDALDICRAPGPPDLVLLDVMMPGLDGYAVCLQLKADPKTARIPVIFVTGSTTAHDDERCLTVGAADLVSKPLHVGLLLRRIETHLALVSARAQVARLAAALRC
jgi:putative two-component system response regulator